ncbi:MAG: SDR family NAD(P)-dependent oxidoreductase [Patescibacteria group bacterium]
MFELKDKVALVTGARRGMGRAHALALAKQGAIVVVTDINLAECEVVVKEIKSGNGRAQAFQLDVANAAEVDQVISAVIAEFGRLDILVNNAGVFLPKPALELTAADWDKTLNINLKGQFLCAQRAAREMIKQKWGRIINISSIASGQVGVGYPNAAHYTASKGGVIALTETLAIEWGQFGITVNAIAPGAIDTPMANFSAMPQDVLAALLARVPLRRIGQPEEVAPLVVFLASAESSYITGATFYVDGGWLAN